MMNLLNNMNRRANIKKLIYIIPLFLMAVELFAPSNIRAVDYFSEHFMSHGPVVDNFGGRSASANFDQLIAGGQSVIGESTSTNFVMQFGFLYYAEKIFNPKSQNWRWYGDFYNETPWQPLSPENTAPSDVPEGNIIKLRLAVKTPRYVAGTDIKFGLQFSESSDFSQAVYDVTEIADCTATSSWCYADGAGADNAIITSKVLSDTDSCSGSWGKGCGTHNESGVSYSYFDPSTNAAVEYEFTIKSVNVSSNVVYFFRAFDKTHNKPVSAGLGEVFPSLSVGGINLSFSISGLEANTSTEGVITDVNTAADSVAFGNLTPDAEIEAAQRLKVSTNAAGYQIFIFQRQGLLGPSEITPIEAVNESPSIWTMPPEINGVYGYHTGDDTLSGNSARFAPDNTYARMESIPKEVVHSSIPVENEITDIIYKVEINNQQEAGEYNSAVVYILVPNF